MNSRQIYETLFKEINGYVLSEQAQENLSYYYYGYTYGEITYEGFLQIIQSVKPRKGEIFYDLGSGVGKAVSIMALESNISQSIGVELMKEIYEVSVGVADKLNKKFKSQKKKTEIKVLNEDFNNIDFSDGDIIFVNATCFQYEISEGFMKKLLMLKPGSRVITSSIFIDLPEHFNTKSIGLLPFSWGDEEVFINTKI